MTYSVEIELPRSGTWFRYFTNVDSLEEAESIKQAVESSKKLLTHLLFCAHSKQSLFSDYSVNVFLKSTPYTGSCLHVLRHASAFFSGAATA